MTVHEERLRILQMVEAGTVTSEEAVRLLEALDDLDAPMLPAGTAGAVQRLVVRIWDGKPETETPTVNLSLPVGLIDWGLQFAQRMGGTAGLEGIEVGELQQLIREGGRGEILRIDDGNDRIRIELI